jgi:hypothetical protein
MGQAIKLVADNPIVREMGKAAARAVTEVVLKRLAK